MLKKYLNELKLSKLAYLLEIIRLRDFKSKIKAFNKIRRMNLTSEMGLLILDQLDLESQDNFDFDTTLSLISLLFKNYYEEYSPKLYEIFPKLIYQNKIELLNLLSNAPEQSAIILYRDVVIKYGKDLKELPVGKLALDINNYNILFPELYKTLKYDIDRNNVLLLINDFLNVGVAKESHIKRYKKSIQDSLIKILKEACNYKFKKNEFIMQNKDYINLRVFLEAATNIEFYVSNKDTKLYLEKLLKKKDNQLKLFVLENYVKKGKNISKINLNTIAKDNLSRYPLYSFLKYYKLDHLMPKKYANNKALSESDLYINYCISNKYMNIPNTMEFLGEKEANNHKYYAYKFETDFNYEEEVTDPATDYILKNTDLEKTIRENSKTEYIGLSGGFNINEDPSLVETENNSLLIAKCNDDDYTSIINDLLPKKEIIKPVEEKKKEKTKKIKSDKKLSLKERIKVLFFKKKNVIKPKSKKELTFKDRIKSIFTKKKQKDTKKLITKKIKDDKKKKVVEEDKEPSLLRKIFSFNTLLIILFFVFIGSAIILYSYVNGMDILFLRKNTINNFPVLNLRKVRLNKTDKVTEISYKDIYKQPESDYYVLIINKKQKSYYNFYLNTLVENNFRFYIVDLNVEENKNLYQGNESGFVIKDETLIKVKDGEYEFFVVAKTNILKELKDYVDVINKAKKEAEEKKKKEEAEKKKEMEATIKKKKIEKNIKKLIFTEKKKKTSKNTSSKKKN